MSTPATQVTITEQVTDVTVNNTNAITVDLTTEDVSVSINNFAIQLILWMLQMWFLLVTIQFQQIM